MKNITLKDLFISAEELSDLAEQASVGDSEAQTKYLLSKIYGAEPATKVTLEGVVVDACGTDNLMALLFAGYIYSHGLGTAKNYSKAVEYFTKAYDLKYGISASGSKRSESAAKAKTELEKKYPSIVKSISRAVSFVEDQSLAKLYKDLPALSKDAGEIGNLLEAAVSGMSETDTALWEYRYHDTVLVPVEILKTLAAFNEFNQFLEDSNLAAAKPDTYFFETILRCIIDDDDIDDNDYIISGLLMMAGHDNSPLWQYRVGLWYENSERNLEPDTALVWYEKAKKELPAAKAAHARVKASENYKILQDKENGTAKLCRDLYNYTSINPQNSISWLIECALRGDESAMSRLEQKHISPERGGSVLRGGFRPQLYHEIIAAEKTDCDKASEKFFNDIKKASQKYQDEVKRQLARAEAARKKAEEDARRAEELARKTEELARKKEEAKLRAEQEAKRRAEELARKKEEAKLRAEQEAKRRAEEAEKKKILAEQEAKCRAEEAEKKKILDAQKAYQKLLDEVSSLKEESALAISEVKSDCKDNFADLKKRLNSAYSSTRTKMDPYRLKWWHHLFYYAPEKDVDEFFSSESATNASLLRELQQAIDTAETADEKVELCLRTEYGDKSPAALKTYVTKLKKQVKALTEAKDQCKKKVKAIEKQIRYLTKEVSVSDFECEFNGRKALFFILLLWILVSLCLCIFAGKGFLSLVVSCGILGALFNIIRKDEVSFGTILMGFSVTALIVIVIICFFIPEDYEYEDVSELSEIYTEEVYNEDSGDTQVTTVETETSIELDYDYIYEAEDDGWRKVRNDDKYGFINKNGKLVVPVKYDYIYNLEDNGWRKVEINEKYGYIGGNGKEIIKPKYDYIYSPEDNGWRRVELKDKYGFVNSSGTEVVPVKYDYIYSPDDNGWRKVEVNDKKGYINADGTEIIPAVYDYMYSWSGGLLKVEKGDKVGYINREGKLVMPLE